MKIEFIMENFINDYISGEKFTSFCDIMIHDEIWEEYFSKKSLDKIFTINKEKIIVYSRPNFLDMLVSSGIIDRFKEKIVLVTHNSDYGIRNVIPNIHIQFSQNICIDSEKLISLPIGLENSYNFPEIGKIDKMKRILNQEKKIKNLVYMNHTISTNPAVRSPLYDLFGGKSYFTSVKNKNNGIDFDDYLYNIYNHKFVLSPEGNGVDTHRTWECLYMGTIPIVKRNFNNRYLEGKLPICFVDDWGELEEDFLEKEYSRIKNTKWNLELLTFTYWKNLILEHAK